jgi:hypothetical protein
MHFTYDTVDGQSLQQGDLLERTPELNDLLAEVHPHYAQEDRYPYFVVLTQSCDLVIRDNEQCKARYISIAAVRPLAVAIQRVEERVLSSQAQKVLRYASSDRKGKILEALESLFNNNSKDYFYFHKEPSCRLYDSHCAFLNLSIALKASIHYTTLLDARVLSLKSTFQHKLGYLVGNLYSRVGTADWKRDDEWKSMLEDVMKNVVNVTWLKPEMSSVVDKELSKLNNPVADDLKRIVAERGKVKNTQKEEAFEAVKKVLEGLQIEPAKAASAVGRLRNDPAFRLVLK